MNNEKAFIFTTDALLAVILSAFLIYATFSTLDRAAAFEDRTTPVQRVSEDALAAMEETGILARSLQETRTDEIRSVLGGLPSGMCAEVDIYANSSPVLSASRTGCSCADAQELTAARRSFVALNGSSQIEAHAEITGCYD